MPIDTAPKYRKIQATRSENGWIGTDTDLFPAGWQLRPVGELGDVVTGTTPATSSAHYYGGPYPFIGPGDIGDQKYVQSAHKTLSDDGLRISRSLPSDAVLVVCIGATIGKVAMTYGSKSATNQQINAVIPFDGVSPDFLYYALRYRAPALLSLAGRAAVPIVNKSNFSTFLVPVPPLPEQRAIAQVLQAVQQAREATERVIAAARELKRSLLRYLFTYGPVPVEEADKVVLKETELGPVPCRWDMFPLRDLLVDGPQNGLYKHVSHYGTGIAIIRIDDFGNEGSVVSIAARRVALDPLEVDRYRLDSGDILINRVNSLSHLGKAAMICDPKEDLVFESNMMRLRVNTRVAAPEFVFRFLTTQHCKESLRGKAKRAVAQSSINQGDVQSTRVPVPSPTEQQGIIGAMAAIDRKLAAEERHRHVLTTLLTSLLDHLMTGTFRVPLGQEATDAAG